MPDAQPNNLPPSTPAAAFSSTPVESKLSKAGNFIKKVGGAMFVIGASKLMGAGGAVIGAGVAQVKNFRRSQINMFCILAILAHVFRYVVTGGEFGVNPFTLLMDALLLFVAIWTFAPSASMSVMFGAAATVFLGSYVNMEFLPRILPFLSKFEIHYVNMPLLVLAIWAIVLYNNQDRELRNIMFALFMQLSVPLINTFDVVRDAGWTVVLVAAPYWLLYGIFHESEQEATGTTYFVGFLTILMLIFPLLFFNVFDVAWLQGFSMGQGISTEQKVMWENGWSNVKENLKLSYERAACATQVAMSGKGLDAECMKKLNQNTQVQVITNQLDVTFLPPTQKQSYTTSMQTFSYATQVRVKNEVLDMLTVELKCGLTKKSSEAVEGDYTVGTPSSPIIRVPRGEAFDRIVRCSYSQSPSMEKPFAVIRADIKEVKASTSLSRYVVAEKDESQTALYSQLVSKQFPNLDYSAKADRGFAHMNMFLDRPGGLVELDAEAFSLDTELINNGKGKITLKGASLTLPAQFSAQQCTQATVEGQTALINPQNIPTDFLVQRQSTGLTSCTLQYIPTTESRTLPVLVEVKGSLTYDYTIEEYAQLSIKQGASS